MKTRTRASWLVSTFALLALASGCSGARSHIVAPKSDYPISLSNGVRDGDGKILDVDEREVVGRFEYDYWAWGMFWRIFSFTGDKDISSTVNEQVKKKDGDAIINLEVVSENCFWNMMTIIGLLPDCNTVTLTGNIIKAKEKEAPPVEASSEIPQT